MTTFPTSTTLAEEMITQTARRPLCILGDFIKHA